MGEGCLQEGGWGQLGWGNILHNAGSVVIQSGAGRADILNRSWSVSLALKFTFLNNHSTVSNKLVELDFNFSKLRIKKIGKYGNNWIFHKKYYFAL